MQWLLVYAAIGCVIGYLAGLLGVGGGAMTVPLLVICFTAQNFPREHILHLALGTSLACIVFTSASSLRAHHFYGAVNWRIFRNFSPGIVIGTLSGALVAGSVKTSVLTVIFSVFIFYAATDMLIDKQSKPTRQVPGAVGLTGVGLVVGMASSLVAAGGGFLTIPFMTWCNVKLHEAIGTSAALGFAIAVPGACGYVYTGLDAGALPAGSLGFVYLPAVASFAVGSVIFAPVGAATSHRLPVHLLKKIFAVVLYALALKMLSTLL